MSSGRVLELVTLAADHEAVDQSLGIALSDLPDAELHGHRLGLVQHGHHLADPANQQPAGNGRQLHVEKQRQQWFLQQLQLIFDQIFRFFQSLTTELDTNESLLISLLHSCSNLLRHQVQRLGRIRLDDLQQTWELEASILRVHLEGFQHALHDVHGQRRHVRELASCEREHVVGEKKQLVVMEEVLGLYCV